MTHINTLEAIWNTNKPHLVEYPKNFLTSEVNKNDTKTSRNELHNHFCNTSLLKFYSIYSLDPLLATVQSYGHFNTKACVNTPSLWEKVTSSPKHFRTMVIGQEGQ